LFDEIHPVIIGNDVWIGANAVILDKVKIGDGAVIAAGAIVSKDVKPYTIVGGIPAKPIKKRFSEEEIEKLLEFKWWEKDIRWIRENYELFSKPAEFFSKTGHSFEQGDIKRNTRQAG
jgi:tetrahydrodipicolinate N-succinyltransferase